MFSDPFGGKSTLTRVFHWGMILMLTKDEIDELLELPEGKSLDFKEAQYQFVGCKDDVKKSELLKDILAFANTPRLHDAYILIGIREIKGGRSMVIGADSHLEDSAVQQFVNSKTTQPVSFSYEATPYGDVTIGVIKIDREQPRPITIKAKFGVCAPGRALIRRGSSTAEATPEEIFQIASATLTAQSKRHSDLSLFFFDLSEVRQTEEIVASRSLPSVDGKIPKFYSRSIGGSALPSPGENEKFYSDGADYLRQEHQALILAFGLINNGSGSANDIALKLKFKSANNFRIICDLDAVPEPSTYMFAGIKSVHSPVAQVEIERSGEGWSATYMLASTQKDYWGLSPANAESAYWIARSHLLIRRLNE
jgi:hypothetical protein